MDESLRATARQFDQGKKRRVLSTQRIVFLVVAAAAPLAAMIGNLPIALARGNGAGTPGAFLFAGVTLICFAVGYAAMSRRVVNTGAFYTYVAKGLGKRAGVAINPATPALVLEEILPDTDQVLVMTVNPGFGNQPFLHTTLPKIRRVARMIDQLNPRCELEVDGGIDEATAPLAVAAGANVLVSGSAIFSAGVGVCAAMDRLRNAINSRVVCDHHQD